ncbi:unnamed protein product [Lactuca saligna]|uniref:Uncharacterized protein n=1 Tax=Lactuca saligna TaxID=75948 RepID=A0AA35ZYL6_LACSI|nr:unnamed protein product [Lactuca saligna]
MDASHTKIVKIWCKNCFFCIKKYPIPICILLLFFLSYMFMPLVYTFLIYSSPLVGISFIVHRVLLGIDRQKIKKAEQDDKRKKFAKSRRSFKSKYGDRTHLSRRNTNTKTDNFCYSDTDFEDNDDIFSKSLSELLAEKSSLFEKKPTNIGEVNVESIVGRHECSSSYDYRKYGNHVNDDDHKNEVKGGCWDFSADEGDDPQDKTVRWAEDDQKNVMDLGLLETERNKRLEGLMQRRRSKKNLGFQDKDATTENNNNGQISAIKVVKINPFLEVNSGGKKSPGSAPSLLATRNPFDLPYDPHEEKPDLSGDNFHEELTANQHKEPMFCRHQSFSLGAFSHPDATHDNRKMSFYKDLATKRFTLAALAATTIVDDNPKEEGEEDGTEKRTKEIDAYLKASISEGNRLQRNANSFDCSPSTMLDERKADIVFFYGGKKRIGHAPSNSIVSDLQVELSDEENSLKDLDLDKEKGSWLNLSNLSKSDSEVALKPDGEEDDTNPLSDEHYVAPEDNHGIISSSVVSTDLPSSTIQEMGNRPQSLNSDIVQSNQLQESPDGLTEVAIRQAHVTSSSPKSVLERGFSTDQASPYHFSNEVQQPDNHT